MQVPIISGIYTGANSTFRRSYPFNMIAVPIDTGFSQGFLKQHEGVEFLGLGSGIDRGGYEWNGVHYRVQGNNLISVDKNGKWAVIGDVGSGGWCQFSHSFDYLAINSGDRIYLYDGTALAQIVDPDLGKSYSVAWIDGYFVSTDGISIVVTDLNNSFSVDPLKYGSSESNPDKIQSIARVRSEVAAINRYSIEFFQNVGGTGFPFSRVNGATVTKGAVGPRASVVFDGKIIFCGSGQGEGISIYSAQNGATEKLSTQEIDLILEEYTDAQLSNLIIEKRIMDSHSFIYIHLHDKTLLFDVSSSMELKSRVWTILGFGSGLENSTKFRNRGFVFIDNAWFCADSENGSIGKVDFNTKTYFGTPFVCEFSTMIIFASGADYLINSIEVFGTSGFSDAGQKISIEKSNDGLNWSVPRYISLPNGFPTRRLQWRNLGRSNASAVLRLSCSSLAMFSFARLEVKPEVLA